MVTVNTTSVDGATGYLDLQFEPGPAATNFAAATVTGFTTDGALVGSAGLTGDVAGQLPGTLTFDNQTVLNDYFQQVTFGTKESFDVTLNGPTPSGGQASAFNILFYAADGATSILTTDTVDGLAGQITLNSNGSTTVLTEPATVGEPLM